MERGRDATSPDELSPVKEIQRDDIHKEGRGSRSSNGQRGELHLRRCL